MSDSKNLWTPGVVAQNEGGSPLSRIASLDCMRLFAMGLVTIQHSLSVLGYYEQTTCWGVNIGQAGVAIFCALSGYLAFRSEMTNPWSWLKRRLGQMFPAYWIVTVLSFSLTLMAGTKQITWPLFISQMLGTGYFTHGWELVNVVSWFISLILLCYVVGVIAVLIRRIRLVLMVVACVCAGLLLAKEEVDLSRHVLTFALAGLVACAGIPARRVIFIAAICVVASSVATVQFIYAASGLSLLAISLGWQMPENALVKVASSYTYEFFLVHGIFLVGFARLMPDSPIASVIVALSTSSVMAVMLHKTVKRIYRAMATYLLPRTSNV